MLAYNICSRIRRHCLPEEERHISISRLRELLIHASGWIATKGRTRYLFIAEGRARLIFANICRKFEVDTTATVRRSTPPPPETEPTPMAGL